MKYSEPKNEILYVVQHDIMASSPLVDEGSDFSSGWTDEEVW